MSALFSFISRWRSSKALIISTAILGLFSESFLYGFIVPILPYMIETRLHLPIWRAQRLTTSLLTLHGLIAVISAPVIAHFLDKTPNRRVPLLLSLAGCTIGTALMAIGTTPWHLYLGRTIQAVSGSGGWITSFSTLADNVASERMNQVLGLAFSFVTAGITTGPIVSGALLELVGYWYAWSAPIVLLTVNFAARLVLVEHSEPIANCSDEEQAPLIINTESNNKGQPEDTSPSGFYRTMLTDIRIIVGLLNTLTFSALLACFDTTLPLHLQEVFSWGSFPVGLVFLGLQIPGILLSPIMGWLRGSTGLKYPTVVGWTLIAVLAWLSGNPGRDDAPWASPETFGKTIFVASMVGIGTSTPLVRDAGIVQLTAIVKEKETERPGIFGDSGYSRTFSLTDIAFNSGTMIGPLFAGTLTEALGFYHMICVLSGVCLLVGFLSLVFLARSV